MFVGLVERNIIKVPKGRPKVVCVLTEKGRRTIGVEREVGGAKAG